jgi:hypothetical protein
VKYGIKSGLFLVVVGQIQQQQEHSDLSKELMTIKAQLLAVVNRRDYVENNLMMKRRK